MVRTPTQLLLAHPQRHFTSITHGDETITLASPAAEENDLDKR